MSWTLWDVNGRNGTTCVEVKKKTKTNHEQKKQNHENVNEQQKTEHSKKTYACPHEKLMTKVNETCFRAAFYQNTGNKSASIERENRFQIDFREMRQVEARSVCVETQGDVYFVSIKTNACHQTGGYCEWQRWVSGGEEHQLWRGTERHRLLRLTLTDLTVQPGTDQISVQRFCAELLSRPSKRMNADSIYAFFIYL